MPPPKSGTRLPTTARHAQIEIGSVTDRGTASPDAKMLRRKSPVIGEYMKQGRDDRGQAAKGLSIQIPSAPAPLPARRPRLPTPQSASSTFTSPASYSPYHRDLLEEARRKYQTSTPSSQAISTPDLGFDSPSALSIASHNAAATPVSAHSYSPQVALSPGNAGQAIHIPSAREPTQSEQHGREAVKKSQIPPVPRIPTTSTITKAQSRPDDQAPEVKPEFKHLVTATSVPAKAKSGPPPRPSRAGQAPLYGDDDEEMALISTDRSRTTAKNKTASAGTETRLDSTLTQDVGTAIDRVDSNNSIPAPSTAHTRLSIRPVEKPRLIDTSPVLGPSDNVRQAPPAAAFAASSKKPGSPFGLFNRRARITSPTSEDKDAFGLKKGPQAGTGHEGYGKHSMKRQSGSTGSTKRMSNGSSGSQPNDDFLARKATPVFLRKDADGQLTQSKRSSGGMRPGSRASQVSAAASPAVSQGSIQPAPLSVGNMSSESVALMNSDKPSRSVSTRGRGASIASVISRPRKSSKDSKREPSEDRESNVSKSAGKTSALRSFFGFGPSKIKTSSSSRMPQPVKPATPEPRTKRVSFANPQTQAPKPVAHYEILNEADDNAAESNDARMEEISQILREAANNASEPRSDVESGSLYYINKPAQPPVPQPYTIESQEVGLTLSPELRRQHPVRDLQAQPTPAALPTSQRPRETPSKPSRLPTVGRIPQVVPRAEGGQQSKSSTQPGSSIPSFSRPLIRPVREIAEKADKVPQPAMVHEEDHDNSYVRTNRPPTREGGRAPAKIMPSYSFMKMHRPDSDVSTSSSGSFYIPTPAATAVLPTQGAPASPDEVWPEYDELVEDVRTPPESGCSATGADYFSKGPKKPVAKADLKLKSNTVFPNLGEMAATLRSPLSPFMGVEKRSPAFSGFEHPALKTPTPSPPDDNEPLISRSQSSKLTRRSSAKGKQPVPPTASKAAATIDMRKFAVDISKWLAFDRILVSPAHDELLATSGERILVVDGLGKEWSLFCARQYHPNDVHGLSPAPYETRSQTSPLPNFRHVRSSNLAVSFPFPSGHFAAVIFRFPVATSDFSLDRAISECKRVLRPGGYLEVCVLDLDLTVMGPRTRRAIKDLKMRMQAMQPDVSLKPTSDHIQYLLGRHGMEDLNRCLIGPPVAGSIPSSPDGSIDQGQSSRRPSVGEEARKHQLLRNFAPKVGQWWYTKTYEQKIMDIDKGTKSIWSDPALVRECKDKGAAFKLLVCYAQKPVLNKRKTQSL